MAPEAAQQHHTRRRRHLRGLPELPGQQGRRRSLLGDAVGRRYCESLKFFLTFFAFDAKKREKTHLSSLSSPKLFPQQQDRARLESFDRAITCEPEDFPDKREGLAADLR